MHKKTMFGEKLSFIKLQKQKKKTDCGIACAAMLRPDLTYDTVGNKLREVPRSKSRAKMNRTNPQELMHLCKHLDLRVQLKTVVSWDQFCPVSIIPVNHYRNKYHWILRLRQGDNNFIIDPHPEEDFVINSKNWENEDYIIRPRKTEYISVDIKISAILL